MTTKQEVEREVQRLQRTVAEAVAEPETVDLAGITAVLHQATAQVQALRRTASRGEKVAVPADRMHAYFPPRSAVPKVGPMLTPAETAQRLGVSPVTVNKWRRQDKLLGLRFDDHQYVYPLFQFADSPLQGERGVLRHLDGVLQALGERTAWEKALFLLTAHPRLGGKTPVGVLREKPSPDVLDRLYLLAQHAGEMGT